MTVMAPPVLQPSSAALPRLLAGLGHHQQVLGLAEHERSHSIP